MKPPKGKGPIKTQQEADEVFEYLVATTAETLKISTIAAKMRVIALVDYVKKHNINALTRYGQMMIDQFLEKPQPNEPHDN